MNVLLRLLIALVIGVIVAWVVGLLLNQFWAVLIGFIFGAAYFLGSDRMDRIG